jgi:hypothetical protein
VWAAIDDGVRKTVGGIRVAQKVFPSIQLDATSVPADDVDTNQMTITEGKTKPYVELSVKFLLTSGQVNADPTGAAVINLVKRAATYLASAEDLIILQGAGSTQAGAVPLPGQVAVEAGAQSIIKDGIVGLAAGSPIAVNPSGSRPPKNSGEKILAGVEGGIARLTKNLQAPPFALILDTNALAAVSGSVINGVRTTDVLTPLLIGGIYGTAAMPANTGLLLALGGDPTTIYFGSDPVTEPTHQESGGRYSFRIFERIQYVARDASAFVKLDFS